MIEKITTIIQNGINNGMAELAVDTAMLVVTFVSVLCAFAAYFHQKNRGKKEAACKLAKYYADVVLEKYRFISAVLESAGLDKRIKESIDFNKLHFFDREELVCMLRDKKLELSKFMRDIFEIDPSVILKAETVRNTAEKSTIVEELAKKYEATGTITDEDKEFLHRYFMRCVTDFLNSLEWFCMNCQYGIADEKLLYQSLQKTFSSAVWLLAPIICFTNINNADKTYTNVIWLFLEWRKRLTKLVEKERKRVEALERKVKKAEAQMRENIFTGKRLK